MIRTTNAVTTMSEQPATNSKQPRPAVVLVSGGLDSAVTLAIARQQGYQCHALSFDYGQRHRVELEAARRVGEQLGVISHRWVKLDLRAFGHSALTDDIDVPKDRAESDMTGDIPVTYVPARNTIFLAHALALAEVIEAADVFIGVNAVDYSGYPDCRPKFIEAFTHMANLATKAGVQATAQGRHWLTIHTPLLTWSKVRIIEEGLKLGVDFAQTHSCYDPDKNGQACGHCDACLLRIRAFAQLGMQDPVIAE